MLGAILQFFCSEVWERYGIKRFHNSFFRSIKESGEIPITDKRMTRFMISLEEGVKLVWEAFSDMMGGEIYVKKHPLLMFSI